MTKLLLLAVIVSLLSLVTSVKEWKNFENGKVYSRKMTNEKNEIVADGSQKGTVVEERLLHSHHKDRNRKINAEQSTNPKPLKMKNPERHHKKTVEEEMHLRPLNERHHKFPNPALLDKTDSFSNPSSKVSRHAFLQQVRRKQNHRRSRGEKRLKRNKSEHKSEEAMTETTKLKTKDEKAEIVNGGNQEQVKKSSNPKQTKIDALQYTQVGKEGFPLKQTSYW